MDFRRTLTIGRQNLYATAEDVDSFFGECGISPKQPYERFGSTEFAEPFLQMLGAESIDAIDASDYEGANLIHDLNKPLPAEWHSRYSAFLEFGAATTIDRTCAEDSETLGSDPSVDSGPRLKRRVVTQVAHS